MQFADSKLPPITPAADRHEISPRAPINAPHKVVSGFQDAMEGVPREAPQHAQDQPGGGSAAAPAEPAPYTGEGRRVMCRSIHQVPVLLDTRSGVERRKNDQLGEAPPTHADSTA